MKRTRLRAQVSSAIGVSRHRRGGPRERQRGEADLTGRERGAQPAPLSPVIRESAHTYMHACKHTHAPTQPHHTIDNTTHPTHTHTHTNTHTHTHTHTHNHTHTHTHTHTHRYTDFLEAFCPCLTSLWQQRLYSWKSMLNIKVMVLEQSAGMMCCTATLTC